VQHVLRQAGVHATVIGGLADDAKGAALLSGGLAGKLDRTLLIRTARDIAQQLVHGLPAADASSANPSARVAAVNAPGPAVPRAAAGTTAGRQGRHQASPQAPGPQAPGPPALGPSAPGQVPSAAAFPPPPGARHAQAPQTAPGAAQAAAGAAESDQIDWAGAERLKWRERERQQSGGV
jgi:hypothetical protein